MDPMLGIIHLDAMLCDHAEVADSKLFINGGGINLCWSQTAQPPFGLNVAVAAIAHVPYTATNEMHRVKLSLQYEDGEPVRPWQPEGASEGPIVELTNEFNIGRPPNLPAGLVQEVPMAFGISIPVARLGGYVFVLSLQDQPTKHLPLRFMQVPQQQQWGPGSIPRL